MVIDNRLEFCCVKWKVDKLRSVDESFLFATVDFIPKSVTQREDHGIKVTSLSISWDYFSEF